MPLSADVDPYLVAGLGAPTSAGGVEVKFDCPQPSCAERRRLRGSDPKLYINTAKEVFFCMRCSWGGPLSTLYKFLGLVYEKQQRPLPPDFTSCIKFKDEEATATVHLEEEKSQEVVVPPTSSDWLYSGAWEYVSQRLHTIPYEEVVSMIVGGVIRRGIGRYWDRVFFVDIYDSRPRYWTGRTILDHVNPKYLNPYGVPRHSIMFNQQTIEDWKYPEVYVCEGVISAIVAGQNAVATYGRCVTDSQIRTLVGFNVEKLILVSESDLDAKKSTSVLAEKLVKRGQNVYIVDCPLDQDPASLGRSSFQEYARQVEVKYDWKSDMMRRLQHAA